MKIFMLILLSVYFTADLAEFIAKYKGSEKAYTNAQLFLVVAIFIALIVACWTVFL